MSDTRNPTQAAIIADPMIEIANLRRELDATKNSLNVFKNANARLPQTYAENKQQLLTHLSQLRFQIRQLGAVPVPYPSGIEAQVNTASQNPEPPLKKQLEEVRTILKETEAAVLKMRNDFQLQQQQAKNAIAELTENRKKLAADLVMANTQLVELTTNNSTLSAELTSVKTKLAETEEIAIENVAGNTIFQQAMLDITIAANEKLRIDLENALIEQERREGIYQNTLRQLREANMDTEQELGVQLALARARADNIEEQSEIKIKQLRTERNNARSANTKLIDNLRASIMDKQTEINHLLRRPEEATNGKSSKRKRESNRSLQSLTESYESKIQALEVELKKVQESEMSLQELQKSNALILNNEDAQARIADLKKQLADAKQELLTKTQVLNDLEMGDDVGAIFCKYVTRINYLEAACVRMKKTIDSQMATIADYITAECHAMSDKLGDEANAKKIKTDSIGTLTASSPALFAATTATDFPSLSLECNNDDHRFEIH